MKRNKLNDISIFIEVAKANGFRAAANNLNLSAGSVSEAVHRLEDSIGVRLFDRTTRKIALTSLGQQLYERSLPAINDIEYAINEVSEAKGGVSGTLKLNAPHACGPFFLDRLIAEYAIAYPNVDIELIYDDQKVDLVSSGLDAVIRSQSLLEQDTHGIPIGSDHEIIIVASPNYLEKNGVPNTPEDLIEHHGVIFSLGHVNKVIPWLFKGKEGAYSVMPKPRIRVNGLVSMLKYVESGIGLAYVYASPVQPLIEAGRLLEVLKGQVFPSPKYTINYLSKRHMPERLRVFIEMAKHIK